MSDEELTRFRIRFTEVGRTEYDETALWYAAHSPETAARWLEGFEEAIASLSTLPGIHPIAQESQHFGRTVRRLLYRQFRLLYYVEEPSDDEPGTVYVLSVRHGAVRPTG